MITYRFFLSPPLNVNKVAIEADISNGISYLKEIKKFSNKDRFLFSENPCKLGFFLKNELDLKEMGKLLKALNKNESSMYGHHLYRLLETF